MRDKQIIAKDVDTSACKFFRNDICASPINSNCKLCDEISEKMCYYKQLKRAEQKLAKIEELLEPIKCKHPEDCWENKPDWNGEVYGCEPDDMDNIASCPSKVATSVLQIIEGKENERI